MHYFEVRNIQYFVMYFFPGLLAVFLIGVGLAFTHFRSRDSVEQDKEALYEFPGGVRDARNPFPLILLLVIVGTVIWAFFYILAMGLFEVRI